MPNEQNDHPVAETIRKAMALSGGIALPQPSDPGPRPWPDDDDEPPPPPPPPLQSIVQQIQDAQ
jgi:hypothetical protein